MKGQTIWASGEVICSKWEGLWCRSKRTTCVSNHSLGGLKLKPHKWFCFWASGMQLGCHGVETGEQMSCQSHTYGEGAAWSGDQARLPVHPTPGCLVPDLCSAQWCSSTKERTTLPRGIPLLQTLLMPNRFSQLFHYKHKPFVMHLCIPRTWQRAWHITVAQ